MLINDADWELYVGIFLNEFFFFSKKDKFSKNYKQGQNEYEIEAKDKISFISTLHGG